MQRRPPKRLVFSIVKRKPPPARPRILLHVGNAPGQVSGCILLRCTDAFSAVAVQVQRAAQQLGAALAEVPRFGHQFTGTVHLNPAELAWLQSIPPGRVG